MRPSFDFQIGFDLGMAGVEFVVTIMSCFAVALAVCVWVVARCVDGDDND